jgi:hypothetical protein
MSSIKVYPKTGVGDLLILKDFLSSSCMDYYDSIELHVSTEESWGRDKQYNIFRDELMDSLYSEDVFKIVRSKLPQQYHSGSSIFYKFFLDNGKSTDYPYKDAVKQLSFSKIPETLCDGYNAKKTYGKKYAVLSTRVRDLDFDEALVERIIIELAKHYDSVLVIGENSEDKTMKMPNIYHMIMKIRNQFAWESEIIDLATNELTFQSFKKENSIMRDAAMSVILGWGGNMCRQIYIDSDNLACLYDKKLLRSHPLMERLVETDHHVYMDDPVEGHDFFERITP